jgi:two-component system chemotaxis sensor kinase CheA
MTNSDELEEIQMYIAESREHLATIETDLLDMEAAGAAIDEKLVNKVFRAAHSIKGGAGFFGLKKIQELGHKVENVLDLIRSRKIVPNPEIINLFLLSFDCLRGMVNDYVGSNQVDISEFVVALSGLTTSYLPEKDKASIKKMVEVKTAAGRAAFWVSEFDLARAKEREEYVYLIEIDLIHDVHQRGQTPWDVFKNYLACGTLMECELNFEAVGTLDDESSNRIPLDLLFATIVDPSFIHSLFEDIPQEKIVLIQGPAHPQPLVKPDLVISERAAQDGVLLESGSEPDVRVPAGSLGINLPGKVVYPEPKVEWVGPATAPEQRTPTVPEQRTPTAPEQRTPPPGPVVEVETVHRPAVEDTLRVNVHLLENLMNLASEMVLSRNQLQNAIQLGDMQSIKTSSQRVSLTTSELQETIMLTRMQPIGNILNKFPRVVRDLGSERNKEISLEIYGKDVEIDKSLLEGLSEPLTHMVRNAVDHGIEEDQEQRVAQGKNRVGKITLRAYHAAGQVVVEISDDGRGIDTQKVAQTALKKGLISEEKLKLMSEVEKRALIFLAGLSTADKITDVSGRGVGMDVVKTNLDRLGGKMEIDTQLGKGTTFRISLPLTLAIIPSLLVSVNKEKFAIPQMNISELIHVSAAQAKTRLEVIGDAEVLVLREKLIPLLRLADVLGTGSSFDDPESGEIRPDRREKISDRRSKYSDPFTNVETLHATSPQHATSLQAQRANEARRYHAVSGIDIVVINTGVMEYGLVVDELHDTFEIVVRPLGQHLNKCSQYTGASVLGDGRVALILDVAGLATSTRLSSLAGSARAAQLQKQKKEVGELHKDLLTLLLFKNAPQEHCAVPLEMVDRIEHVNLSQIESAGKRRTMQYRGQSLPLLSLKDTAEVGEIADTADLVVLVMNLSGRLLGLLAAQPVDVIDAVVAIDAVTHRQKGISGSTIIGKDTTLLIDVNEIAEAVLGLPALRRDVSRNVSGGNVSVGNPAGTDVAGNVSTGVTILLAEDSSFFRNQVSKYLEADGFHVLAAEDGQAGLDLLRQHVGEVRIVVTDIEMPIMDGLEFTRRIKADPALAHLPVIALTTLADEDDIAAGKAAGVTQYEVKLDKEKLLQTIRQNLLS